MHHFHYQNGELYCENLPVRTIAESVGTPFYLYSHATLSHHLHTVDEAFQGFPHIICFAVKANANLAILRLFAQLGAGADIVSGGELFRALEAGVDPKKVVYSGVGKSFKEIHQALKAGILMFNIESSQELGEISRLAGRLKVEAPVALRINPDIDPQTHPYISTGLKKNKFGINLDRALLDYERAQNLPHVEVVGVACLRELVEELARRGIHIRYLDLGGGLGITYDQETPPHPRDYGQALIKELEGLGVTLILEPGRVLVGNAGILVTRVYYTKDSETKHFIVVDAGMNDLARGGSSPAGGDRIPGGTHL
jgi:diaminopimelate decarboxylase